MTARPRTTNVVIAACVDIRANRAKVDLPDIELPSLIGDLRLLYTSATRPVPCHGVASQVGPDQEGFLEAYARDVLPRLAEAGRRTPVAAGGNGRRTV